VGLPSLSLTTEGSWIHLGGEGCQTSRQPTDASTPQEMRVFPKWPGVDINPLQTVNICGALPMVLGVCLHKTVIPPTEISQKKKQQITWDSLSFRFNGHFPGEPGLAGVY